MGMGAMKLNTAGWLKHSVFFVLWGMSLLILFIVSENNGRVSCYNDASSAHALALPKNQVRGVEYIRWDPNHDYRPVSFISCDNMRVENKIRGLELEFYGYSSQRSNLTDMSYDYSGGEHKITDAQTIAGLITRLTDRRRSFHVSNFDLGNVSEISIEDLDYRVFNNADLRFRVRSKRARSSSKRGEMILRGHVMITGADGGTLSCNRAKWRVKQKHFKIDGVYVLDRHGVVTSGKGILVDLKLNPVREQQVQTELKEDKKCFAKF